MSNLNPDNVKAAITGEVLIGPMSAAAAVTSTSGPRTGLVSLGYLDEDAITITPSRSVDKKKAWQNGDTVRSLVTEADLTIKFVMIETKKETVELYWQTEVTQSGDEGGFDIVPSAKNDPVGIVVDLVDGSDLTTYVFERAELEDRAELKLTNKDLTGHGVTMSASPGSDGKSGHCYSTALRDLNED